MANNEAGLFDACSLAALSDLSSSDWRELFNLLESEQAEFLRHEAQFRSPNYEWARDPLYRWSRVWEYPYVYHHVRAWRRSLVNTPRVVDLGSGVTFFPFAVAHLGCHVTATDIDPVCGKDLAAAVTHVPQAPGQVDFRMTDGRKLPFDDREVEAVYCVSVIEHIPGFENIIAETARILKPGGLMVLTVDLDLLAKFELNPEQYQRLGEALGAHFTRRYPDRVVHPADLLTSRCSPYPMQTLSAPARMYFQGKQVFKKLLGLKPRRFNPCFLAVQGFVLTRRSDQ